MHWALFLWPQTFQTVTNGQSCLHPNSTFHGFIFEQVDQSGHDSLGNNTLLLAIGANHRILDANYGREAFVRVLCVQVVDVRPGTFNILENGAVFEDCPEIEVKTGFTIKALNGCISNSIELYRVETGTFHNNTAQLWVKLINRCFDDYDFLFAVFWRLVMIDDTCHESFASGGHPAGKSEKLALTVPNYPQKS